LETGRSQPSRDFVIRIATDLNLSLPQRAALFDASGHKNPYRQSDFGEAHMTSMLDMLERRVLQHWPFPGLILDEAWNILRSNGPAQMLLSQFASPDNAPMNLYEIFLSDSMRERIENWQDAAVIFYLRMHAASAHSELVANALERARQKGLFDHIATYLSGIGDVPPYVPIILRGAGGERLSMTSMVGKLTSLHEVAIEGLEIELMMPTDEETEHCFLGNLRPNK